MRTRGLLLCIASLAGVFQASACGPDFPLMLTSCHTLCLARVTAPDFAFDAVKTATESANPRLAGREGAEVTTVQLEAAEDGTDAAQTLMLKMRGAASGDEAYEQGKGLPEATRLYIAGAVDFDHAHRSHAWGEETSDEEEDDPNGLETALGRFQQILQLPSSEARPRIL